MNLHNSNFRARKTYEKRTGKKRMDHDDVIEQNRTIIEATKSLLSDPKYYVTCEKNRTAEYWAAHYSTEKIKISPSTLINRACAFVNPDTYWKTGKFDSLVEKQISEKDSVNN